MGWAQALCFNKTSRWFLLFWNHWSSFLTGLMQTRHKWPEIPPPRGAGCGSGGPRERLWPFLILISEKNALGDVLLATKDLLWAARRLPS